MHNVKNSLSDMHNAKKKRVKQATCATEKSRKPLPPQKLELGDHNKRVKTTTWQGTHRCPQVILERSWSSGRLTHFSLNSTATTSLQALPRTTLKLFISYFWAPLVWWSPIRCFLCSAASDWYLSSPCLLAIILQRCAKWLTKTWIWHHTTTSKNQTTHPRVVIEETKVLSCWKAYPLKMLPKKTFTTIK